MLLNLRWNRCHQDNLNVPSPSASPRRVWSVAGGLAELPCNVSLPLAPKGDQGPPGAAARDELGKESPMLILWYKDGIHKPIYR